LAFDEKAAQQPSPGRKSVIGMYMQAAAHVPALTRRASLHDFAAQEVGQALGSDGGKPMSHTSFFVVSTRRSPQRGEQSPSVLSVQPAGQQPSGASAHSVTSVTTQRALQSSGLPTRSARRQADGVG
jgi:hypothetical protein